MLIFIVNLKAAVVLPCIFLLPEAITLLPVLSKTLIATDILCLSTSPSFVIFCSDPIEKTNSRASQSLEEVSCKVTPLAGTPAPPFFNPTGDAKF